MSFINTTKQKKLKKKKKKKKKKPKTKLFNEQLHAMTEVIMSSFDTKDIFKNSASGD